jgi:hypothetical protein
VSYNASVVRILFFLKKILFKRAPTYYNGSVVEVISAVVRLVPRSWVRIPTSRFKGFTLQWSKRKSFVGRHSWYLVFFDAVADVVELCEDGGDLVHEFAERMQEQVVGNLDDHFRESKQDLGSML